MGYAYLHDRVKDQDLPLWRFIDKLEEVKDKEGYKKQQGKHSIIMGFIFLLVPVSLYLVDKFLINEKLLYLWLPIMAIVVLLNIIQTRKFY